MKKKQLLALLLCSSLVLTTSLSAFAKETDKSSGNAKNASVSSGNAKEILVDEEETSETFSDSASKEHEELTPEQKISGSTNARRQNTAVPSTGVSKYSDSEIHEIIRKKYHELTPAYEISDPFKRTKKIDNIDSYILNFAGDPLADKKITFIGDSITEGVGGTPTLDGTGMNYTDFIANYTSAEIVNLGIGGTPINGLVDDNAIIYRYGEIPHDSDIIVLMAGINDFLSAEKEFGSLEQPNPNTYCGDVYSVFKGMKDMYSDAEIYIVITYSTDAEEDRRFTGDTWDEYVDVQVRMAKQFGFELINLYAEGFLDSHDNRVRGAFFKDDIHPDDLGSEVLGRHILVHLLKDRL